MTDENVPSTMSIEEYLRYRCEMEIKLLESSCQDDIARFRAHAAKVREQLVASFPFDVQQQLQSTTTL